MDDEVCNYTGLGEGEGHVLVGRPGTWAPSGVIIGYKHEHFTSKASLSTDGT